jgi:hypothetical protein
MDSAYPGSAGGSFCQGAIALAAWFYLGIRHVGRSAGRILEKVSGKRLGALLEEKLLI